VLASDQYTLLKPVVALVGPTAVGKSAVGLRVAQALGTEVLAADSRQVYRGMDIGTDKPTPEERRAVPHRLIDLVDPDQPFNVGLYRQHAADEIARLHRQGKLPLVVGGTGLYVRGLLRGLCEGPPADWTMRARLEEEARSQGAESLYLKLADVDPVAAQRLHPHDQVKIIRALEVHAYMSRTISGIHGAHRFADSPYAALMIGLLRERGELYRRIEERVDGMLARGLREETHRLLDRGYRPHLSAMRGVGYKQMAGYLLGDHDYEEAVRLLKRDTRRYAKRQLTWFRAEPAIHWVTITSEETVEQATARVLVLVNDFLARLAGDGGTARSGTGLSSVWAGAR
jgi:tRNA dimethylallyltransferase